MNALDHSIREFSPANGDWRPLDALFERAFSSDVPEVYFDAIFNLFERFPDDDGAGVFWTALHGMEARGNYETKLLRYFRRHPSTMTEAMLRRIYNSGQTHIEGVPIERLIPIKK